MNLVSSSGASLFSKSEMRDVNRRLDSIGGL